MFISMFVINIYNAYIYMYIYIIYIRIYTDTSIQRAHVGVYMGEDVCVCACTQPGP